MELLDVREVAVVLKVTPRRARNLIDAGIVPSVKLGGRILCPRPALEQWYRKVNKQALERVTREQRRAS